MLPVPAATAPRSVLLATLPGLTTRELAREREGAYALPTLHALAQAGVVAEQVASVAPASAHPVHATLATGARPSEHGVVADHRLGEHGVRRALYAHASLLQRATLWQRVAESGRPVAALDWPSTRGAAIDRLLPDAEREGGDAWLEQLGDAATPALREFVADHGGGDPALAAPGAARDSVLLALACELLGGEAPPALLLLRLGGSAPALARGGTGSPEAARDFEVLDARLRALLDCLSAAGALDGLALALIGDHGRAPVHTAIAPNVLLAQAGLLALADGDVESWRAIARSNGGSSFVYARDEHAAVAARLALAAASERTGAFRVVSAEEMLRDGADPEAWFGLEAAPGYGFEDDARGELLRPSAVRGLGGYLPGQRAMDVALVLWGSGVRQGLVVPQMAQLDVAPTLARLLGVELEGTGHPLVGLLSASAAVPGAPE